MHGSTLRALTFVAGLSLLAIGCKQAEGEPCDVNEDCGSGLVCSCRLDVRAGVRGMCVPEGSPDICPEIRPDAGTADAGDPGALDSGASDSGASDAAADGGPEDAGADGGPEDAGTDAGPEDAGTDAGADDAGTDAGTDAG